MSTSRKRKRKDKVSTENSKQSKKHKRKRLVKKKCRKEKHDVVDFSITEAKEDLGLDKIDEHIKVEDNRTSAIYFKFKKKHRKEAKRLKKKLKPELACCFCLGILRQPVTGSCGHSFCRVCLAQALFRMTDDFGNFKCPQCRKRLSVKGLRRFAVNKSLACVLETLFKEAKPTENEANKFYDALEKLKNEKPNIVRPIVTNVEEVEIMSGIKCTRTIISDPNDPLMRYCLAVSHGFEKCFVSPETSQFSAYLLHMEEDEAEAIATTDGEQSPLPYIITEDCVLQKKDFYGPCYMKHKESTQENSTECFAQALQGKIDFKDVNITRTTDKMSVKLTIPELPELYMIFEITTKLVNHIYSSSVFGLAQESNFDRAGISIDESSDDDSSHADDETDDENNSFIVDTDDEFRMNELESVCSS